MLWLCSVFTSRLVQQSVTDSLCPLPTTAMDPQAWTHYRTRLIPGAYHRGTLPGSAALAGSSLRSEHFPQRSYCRLSSTWLARSHILTGSQACAGRRSVSIRTRYPCRMVWDIELNLRLRSGFAQTAHKVSSSTRHRSGPRMCILLGCTQVDKLWLWSLCASWSAYRTQ